ncbi:hypothetical protein Pint_30986 [Pistacia integerrima]|uniref:Uncharacterized protein n=1 Tax=Pistacia integerrima TaxID=434235 RepID=A0ACC0XN11_9ROSI|nr:hypothetical protein Pint_30986 [Pistacia integerrima]
MNPSRFAENISGVSNSSSNNQNLSSNSSSILRSSSPSRPRLHKMRKQFNSESFKLPGASGSGFGSGSNPFLVGTNRFGYESGGGSSSNAFVFGTKKNALGNNVVDEMRKLKIGSEKEGNNVGGLGGKDMESWLEIELRKKLSVKEGGEVDGKKFVFSSSKERSFSFEEFEFEYDSAGPTDMGRMTSGIFVNDKQDGNMGDDKFNNLGKAVPTEFTFQAAMEGKYASGGHVSVDQPKEDARASETGSSSSSFSSCGVHFQSVNNASEVFGTDRLDKKNEFSFTSTKDGLGTPFVEFKTPLPKANLLMAINEGDVSSRETKEEHSDRGVGAVGPSEDSISGAETESLKSAN